MWSLPKATYCLGMYLCETFVSYIYMEPTELENLFLASISVKFFSNITIKYWRILYKNTPRSLKNQTLGGNTSQKVGSSNLLLKLLQKGMFLPNKKPLVATITRVRTNLRIKS